MCDTEAHTEAPVSTPVLTPVSTPKKSSSIGYTDIRCDILDQQLKKYRRTARKQENRISDIQSLIMRLETKNNDTFNEIKITQKKNTQILSDELKAIKLDLINYKKYNDNYIDRAVCDIYIWMITIIFTMLMYKLIL